MTFPDLSAALAAARARPRDAAAWRVLGVALLAHKQPAEAVSALTRATALDPRADIGWSHLGLARRAVLDHTGALQALEQAARLAPTVPANWGNLVAARSAVGDVDGAVVAARTAVSLEPTSGAWLAALGNALRTAGDTDGALAAYDRAEALLPGDPRVPWNRALTWLSAHDFGRGFAAYEARRERPQHRPVPGPVWESGPAPARLLVWCEQGFGDTLQWSRFLARLAASPAVDRVVVAAPARLVGLLSRLSVVAAVVDKAQVTGPKDVACTHSVGLMSLGARLGATGDTLADGLPLLRPSSDEIERWRGVLAKMAAGARLRVGVCWQGNPAYELDHLRSPPLRAFSVLAELPGVALVSLQKVHGLDQLAQAPPALRGMVELGSRLDTATGAFVESSAVMAALDVVVTGDTASAHLAGTLGVPTCLVLSQPADWRWGHLPHSTPWYPSVRLFRQPGPGDWGATFQAVATALSEQMA